MRYWFKLRYLKYDLLINNQLVQLHSYMSDITDLHHFGVLLHLGKVR